MISIDRHVRRPKAADTLRGLDDEARRIVSGISVPCMRIVSVTFAVCILFSGVFPVILHRRPYGGKDATSCPDAMNLTETAGILPQRSRRGAPHLLRTEGAMYIPIPKQSKKARRAYFSKSRRTWGISLVTRTTSKPNAYDRNREKALLKEASC